MNQRQRNNLQKELRAAGATNTEVAGLVAVANRLHQLKPEQNVKSDATEKQHKVRWRKVWAIGLPAMVGVVIGIALVIFSQAVLPNNVLYPIQKFSDKVAVALHPDYRQTVMMRRAQQVNSLVGQHASSKIVLATLDEYNEAAASYKTMANNYPAFEYCKSNLQQAAVTAQGNERQAINATLDTLSI